MGKQKNNPKIIKKGLKKNQTKKKSWNRISILTGTAFAVQCSTHWAAGNLPWKKANLKIICNKYHMYCKVQMGKDSEEDVFFNSEITLLQKLYCLI